MTTITVTEARRKLYKLVDTARLTHLPIHIAGKRGGAVLLSEEDWSSVEETLHLLSIPEMRRSIVQGMKTPVSKCAKELRW